MKENQWMSLLGLANRARKIISGEELAVKEIRSGKAKLFYYQQMHLPIQQKKLQINVNRMMFHIKLWKIEIFLAKQLEKKPALL